MCGEPGRGVFPELLAYNPALGLPPDGKRHRPLPDSGDEPRFRDDPESLLQVRRLLAGTDLLGVPNLRQRSLELLGYVWKKLWKRPEGKRPYLLQIRPLERYGLLVYSVVVNLFMGFYFVYVIPTFLYRFVQTFPDAVNELILYLSNRMMPPFALLRNISMQLVFLGLIGYLVYRSVIPLVRRYGRNKIQRG